MSVGAWGVGVCGGAGRGRSESNFDLKRELAKGN